MHKMLVGSSSVGAILLLAKAELAGLEMLGSWRISAL